MTTVTIEPHKLARTRRYSAAERAEAADRLRELLPPGTTVYTVLRNVSRSGMMRHIDLYTFKTDDNGKIDKVYLSGYAAAVMDDSRTDNGAIKVGGCGMDMDFHLVYTLSSYLWSKFYNGEGWKCIEEPCIYGSGERDALDGWSGEYTDAAACPSCGGYRYHRALTNCPAQHEGEGRGRNVGHHEHGGYALRQEWL